MAGFPPGESAGFLPAQPGADRGRGLDLCCGSGVQAQTAAAFVELMVGPDINARATAFATLNAELSGLAERVSFRMGDLSEGPEGPFDLVTANPPYVWLPPDEDRQVHAFGGERGLAIAERILQRLDSLLGPHGEAYLISDSPVIEGQSTLPDLTRRVLRGSTLGAELTLLRHKVPTSFQQAMHRTRVDYYLLRVARDLAPAVRTHTLPSCPTWPAGPTFGSRRGSKDASRAADAEPT